MLSKKPKNAQTWKLNGAWSTYEDSGGRGPQAAAEYHGLLSMYVCIMLYIWVKK